MNTSIELNKFNNIKFQEDIHKYYNNEKELISTTTFIKRFGTEFNTDYWSNYVCFKENGYTLKPDEINLSYKLLEQNGIPIGEYLHLKNITPDYFQLITPEQIEQRWKDKSNVSANLGTNVHSFIEFYYNNKIYLSNNIIDTIRYENCKNQFLKFYNNSKDILIPVKSEIVIGDLDVNIAGMIDMLFYNNKYNEYQIWDWKSNEELKLNNNFTKLKSIFNKLDDCDINKYNLQLNIYKKIIEKNTNLKIGNCYIVHLNGMDNEYRLYNILDLQKEISIIFNKIANKNLKLL